MDDASSFPLFFLCLLELEWSHGHRLFVLYHLIVNTLLLSRVFPRESQRHVTLMPAESISTFKHIRQHFAVALYPCTIKLFCAFTTKLIGTAVWMT